MSELRADGIEKSIERLEAGIRELKIRYDMFFAGALPREPHDLRLRLESLIKRCSNYNIRKYHHRFHFNSLVARFNTLCELWGRSVRDLEEGEKPAPAVKEMAHRRERTIASCRLGSNGASDDSLRKLHARFNQARKNSGEAERDVPYRAFAKKIKQQADTLRSNAGCDLVELRVVIKDRQVLVKARPGR